MTKIVHVDSETGFSGGEVQVFLLIEALQKRGFDNVLVCPPGSKALAEGRRLGIETFEVRLRNDLDFGSVWKLASWLRSSGADLVHLHTGRATWLGGLAAKRAGVPAITTRRMDRRVKRTMRTRLMYGSFVRETIAISPAVRDCLVEGGVDADSIRLIWDAVDPGGFEPQVSRSEVRAALETPDSEVVLLTMAALVRRKGIDVLIEALALLRERGFTATLWIGGEGEERGALEELAQARAVSEFTRFLGWRSDKADLLAAADLFLLPSRAEGVGVAALEGMAAGRPVVASHVGGLAQAITHNESGLLVAPENPTELADAIAKLAQDPSLARTLSEGGRQRVREHFSIDSQVSQYIESYNRALAMEVST